MKLRLVMASLMMAMGGSVLATDETFHGRWYLGLAGGVSQLQPETEGSGLTLTEDQSTGTKLVIGRDLTHRFSLEAYAVDLGEALLGTSDEITYEVYGAHLVAHLYNSGSNLGRYFRDGLSLYAKVGAGGMNNESTVPFEQLNETHLTYGLGASGLMGAGFSWRFEAEAYDQDALLVMLGVVKRFGDVPDPAPPSVDYFKSQRGTARKPDADGAGPAVDEGTDIAQSSVEEPAVSSAGEGAAVVVIDETVTVDAGAVDAAPAIEDVATADTDSGVAVVEIDETVAVDGVPGVAVAEIDETVTVDGVPGVADAQNEEDVETAVVVADPVEALSTTRVETPQLPLDSDGDGVLNADDRCDSTAPGLQVDERGCSFTGIVEGLFFASSSAELSRAAMDILDNVIIELIRYPAVLLEVQAHTDNSGPARDNLELSQKRARSVVQYMVQRGVSASRLRAVGYGESRPAYQNATVEGRRLNRRVEFRTVDSKGGS